MKNYYLFLFLLGFSFCGYSQVGIGTVTPDASSQLEVVATNRGILIPRVPLTSTTDKITITNGNVESLLVFNTNTMADITPGYYYWYIDRWHKMGDANSETITTLTDNGDGTVTYLNESGTSVTIKLIKVETLPGQGPGANGAPGTPGSGANGAPGAGVTIVTNDSGTWVYNGDGTWTRINGPKGDPGVVGVESQPGKSGAPGTPGDPGDAGAPGKGVTIVNNDSGTWVYNGDGTWTNINGPKGDKGDNGMVLTQTLSGQSGEPGTPGDLGDPGAPGKGVTIVNNDSGTWVYDGTIWTNINGPKGDKGDNGMVLTQTLSGQSGEPGTPGDLGDPGAPGKGVTIVNNDSGTWVYDGTIWTNINGPKGDKGDNGMVLTQTLSGQSGEPGTPGDLGDPGAPGKGVTIVNNDSGTWVYDGTIWTNINGPKGDPGVVGVEGQPGTGGTPGTPGAGITIVTNDSGTWVYNPTTNTWTNINGPKGDKGDNGMVLTQTLSGQSGEPGTPGDLGDPGAPGKGVTIVNNDSGTWVYDGTTWTNINGPKGDPGVVGVEGQPGTGGTPGTPGAGITIVTNDSGTWVYNPTTNTWTNINGPKGDPGTIGVEGQPGVGGSPGTPGQSGGPGEGVTIVNNDSGTWVYDETTNSWTNITSQIINGTNTTVTGSGTSISPYQINTPTSTLTNNNDGTYTYKSEDGTLTTFKVTQSGAGAPTSTGAAGDVYVDNSTGDIYTHNGTTWVLQDGAPDIITTLTNNNDGTYTYKSEDGTLTTFKVTQSGAGAPTSTGAAGDVYVDNSTGDIYTHNGTTWVKQGDLLAADANNGLTVTSGVVQLGGSLIKPTTITTDATNTLAVAGLQTGAATDRVVVADGTTGVLKTVTQASLMPATTNALTSSGNMMTSVVNGGTAQNAPIINSAGNALSGTSLTTSINGVAATVDLSSLKVEPWQVQGGTTQATTNAENIFQTGSVAVGTSTIPSFTAGTETVTPKFHVAGDVSTTGKFYTSSSVYADYVFEKYFDGFSKIKEDYTFTPLSEVAAFVKANKHLPGVTPIDEISKDGLGYKVDMTTLTVQSLEKIEELYLHVIEQQKQIESRDAIISIMKKDADDMKTRLEKLENLLLNK